MIYDLFNTILKIIGFITIIVIGALFTLQLIEKYKNK